MVVMLTLNYLIEIQQKTFNCSSFLLPVFTKMRFDLTELENLQCRYNTIRLLAAKKKSALHFYRQMHPPSQILMTNTETMLTTMFLAPYGSTVIGKLNIK